MCDSCECHIRAGYFVGQCMTEPRDDITDVWLEHRPYLVDVAFRMLGNIFDAEDAVQEAFGRLVRHGLEGIDDVRGWLVVVVSRLCLDQLRSAHSRRETNTAEVDEPAAALATNRPPLLDPAERVTLDESIGMALLVVLQTLSPAERAVFVLHDVFQFSFDAVGSIVGRSPAACRQLASRARRRIEAETGPQRFAPGVVEHDRIAQRFIAACAGGDLDELVALLDAEVGGDVDVGPNVPPRPHVHGRVNVGRGLLARFGPQTGTTLVSQPVNGEPGVLAFRERQLVGILQLVTRDGVIVDLHAIADPAKLAVVDVQLTSTRR